MKKQAQDDSNTVLSVSQRTWSWNPPAGKGPEMTESTVLQCTVLHCTILYCTVLYCTVLYCISLDSGALTLCTVPSLS